MTDLQFTLAAQRAYMAAREQWARKKLLAIIAEREGRRKAFPTLELSQYPRLSWLTLGKYEQSTAEGRAA